MAKKKQPNPAAKEAKSTVTKTPAVEAQSNSHCTRECAGLTSEVETFLSKRDELAQKLAREIESTEKKLAELKHAAAMLYPDKDATSRENDSTSSLLGLRASS